MRHLHTDSDIDGRWQWQYRALQIPFGSILVFLRRRNDALGLKSFRLGLILQDR
jgi:hypothetical protein